MPQSPNLVLASLPQNVYAAMETHLQPVTLAFGDVIADVGELVSKVYFPFTGVVSLVVPMPNPPFPPWSTARRASQRSAAARSA